jgi:hypothetical protein
MSVTLADQLAAHQTSKGAFKSHIVFKGREEEDSNGCITALTLRALRRTLAPNAVPGVRGLALDFLEQCESSRWQGAFGFWPERERPRWAQRVPPDFDDTAIINLELLLAGRRTREETQRVVYELLVPRLRTDVRDLDPPWIHSLVFPTWLTDDSHRANPVDCCINANVAALMAATGLTHLPGYRECFAMIAAGLEWAGNSWRRLSSLTPYYPRPRELLLALENVSYAAKEIHPCSEKLRSLLSGLQEPLQHREAVCSRVYGGVYWRSPALELARGFAGSTGLSARLW